MLNEMDKNLDGFITKQELMRHLKHIKEKDSEEKKLKGDDDPSTDNKNEEDDDLEEEKPDMRSVLGFLN